MGTNFLREAVIVGYGRSPIAKAIKGSLKNMHPVEYAAQVLKGVINNTPQFDLSDVEDLIVGCAKPEHIQSHNIARLIGVRAGLPYDVPAQTVNRFCASGLQTIATAANAIKTGESEIIIAGGVENQTKIPMGTEEKNKNFYLLKNNPSLYMGMGLTAENVAEQYGVTREEMDSFAFSSHEKAYTAQSKGKFDDEIIPIEVIDENGKKNIFTKDECIRPNTTIEALRGLKTVFKEDGFVTAGNSSQLSDGAAFVIMMSMGKAMELCIKPIARFLSFSVAGVDPSIMGIGPIKAVPKVLKKSGLSMKEIDSIELNEAFAAQALPCIKELGMDINRVNPNGGAIALGHPLGATGSILTCKIISELERTKGKYGLITMCIGGGMGAASIIEMVETKNK